MFASLAALIILGLALAWTALNKSGIPAFDWYVALVLIGLAQIAFWVRPRRMLCPALPAWLSRTILGLLLYMIFQAIPLPLGLLKILSPERAALTGSLGTIAGPVAWAPISVDPAAHVLWFLTIAGCTAAFFLARDLSFRMQSRLFMALLPPVLVAAFEALLGLVQVAGGAEQAVGSYNSRDHYCCILELTLPLTIAFGWLYFSRRRENTSVWPVVKATGCWTISGLLTLAILASLSRAGWVDSIVSLVVLTILLLFPHVTSLPWRIGILVGLLIIVSGAFVYASSGAMLARLAWTSNITAEARLGIWKELVPLTSEFRWFGTGLMGFDPVFLRHQAIINFRRIDFAHNDFLQYLIELGLLGFIPLMFSLGAIVWPVLRGSWPKGDTDADAQNESRVLMAGCTASFAALFLHSLVDFNLYIPANMFTFAWILGFASAVVSVSAADLSRASISTAEKLVLS